MIKNAMVYQIAPSWSATVQQVEAALGQGVFTECTSLQEKSVGWVPPRGQKHGALLEAVGGQWMARLMIETRTVPSEAVKREAELRVASLLQTTGRKPGKKEFREIQADARTSLLPHAFGKHTAIWVWIDMQARLLVMDTTSQACADEVLTTLVRALDGLVLQPVAIELNPSTWMERLLVTESECDFSPGRLVELMATDESKAKVKFTNHCLEGGTLVDEIARHIQQGKVPTALQLDWDGRVQFVLNDALVLRQIKYLDVAVEDREQEADAFDADMTICTGELQQVLASLFAELGVSKVQKPAQNAQNRVPNRPKGAGLGASRGGYVKAAQAAEQ